VHGLVVPEAAAGFDHFLAYTVEIGDEDDGFAPPSANRPPVPRREAPAAPTSIRRAAPPKRVESGGSKAAVRRIASCIPICSAAREFRRSRWDAAVRSLDCVSRRLRAATRQQLIVEKGALARSAVKARHGGVVDYAAT